MKTVNLDKVLEMLINEEHEEATSLLHEWFVEQTKQLHEEMLAEDDTLSKGIEDDQEAIEAEEFYGESEGDNDDDDSMIDGNDDEEDEVEGNDEEEGEVEIEAEEELGETIDELDDVLARLKAEYSKIVGDESDEDFDDAISDNEIVSDIHESISDEKIQKAIKFLDDEIANEEDERADEKIVKILQDAKEELLSGKDVDIEFCDNISSDIYDATMGNGQYGDSDYSEYIASTLQDILGIPYIEESVTDLDESLDFDMVADPKLSGDKEVGSNGRKISVNNKSSLPSKKVNDRVGGEPIETKADDHVGFDREPAPEVKDNGVKAKNRLKKGTEKRTKVSKEGDKSALLNKKDGFGSDSPKSVINGSEVKGN